MALYVSQTMQMPDQGLDPAPVSVRVRISSLWVAMLFVFAYVDLFSLYRADVRADLAAGQMSAFSIDQGFLLAVTAYIAVPSLMVVLTLVLPARVARAANVALALLYAITVVGGAIGEWQYYLLGSVLEVAALLAVVYFAFTWPRVTPQGQVRCR